MSPRPACIFCAIVAGEAPSLRVYEDDHVVAFLDINPATVGHALVVPRTHVADVWEADGEVLGHVMRGAAHVARLARDRLAAPGVNLVQATGPVAWQTVFHLHVHVVPRYPDDGLVLPWRPGRTDEAALAATAARLTAPA